MFITCLSSLRIALYSVVFLSVHTARGKTFKFKNEYRHNSNFKNNNLHQDQFYLHSSVAFAACYSPSLHQAFRIKHHSALIV